MINIPYTYLIKWSTIGYKYYGVRWAANCTPVDFWVKYFTSSQRVLAARYLYGEPDIIEIRKVFIGPNRIDEAIKWEQRVLSAMRASTRMDYLNRTISKSVNVYDPIIAEKLSLARSAFMTSKWRDSEYRKSMSGEYGTTRLKKAWKHPNKILSRKQQCGEKAANYNSTKYKFQHENSGMVVECTQLELVQTHGVNQGNLSQLLNGKRNKVNGWKLFSKVEN